MKGQELIRVHLECVAVVELPSSKNTLATIIIIFKKYLADDERRNHGHPENIMKKHVEQIMKSIKDVA